MHVGVQLVLALLLGVGVAASARVLLEDLHALLWSVISVLLVGMGAAAFVLTDGLSLELDLPIAVLLAAVLVVHGLGWAAADHGGTDPAEETS